MPRPRRFWIRLIGGLVALWLLVVAWGLIFAWRSLPYYMPVGKTPLRVAIMSGGEYERVINTHERPYVVELECGVGAVLLFGAEHTKSSNDPMLVDIEARWRVFRPTVALCESTLGVMFPGFMDPVETFGEPGLVHQLARNDRIPSFTWEPPRDQLVAGLLLHHSKEDVALRFILGPYFSNLRHGKPTDPDAYVEEYRRKRIHWNGLTGTFDSMSALDAYWKERFPRGPDWREVSDQFGLPGFLADIDMNAARDEHFAQVVIDLVNRKERVFAIAGSSHAVKLESALRRTLCGD